MAFVLADRVKETSTTTGTGTLTLAGAVAGFQSFNSGVGNGNSTCYAIKDANGTGWEVGIGTYTNSGTTLSRTTILASSNSGSAITLSSGTHTVFVTDPANKSALFDQLFGSTVGAALVRGASLWAAQSPGGGGIGGLWSGQMSAPVPTSANSGLSDWANQGGATVSDNAAGVTIFAANSGTGSLRARKKSAPSTPYSFTALLSISGAQQSFISTGIGWYDGTKAHTLSLVYSSGWTLAVQKWSDLTTFSANDFSGGAGIPQPVWLKIKDDGTNISFSLSHDGANFYALATGAKSAAYLGSSGYTNVMFFANAQGSDIYCTLLSLAQGS